MNDALRDGTEKKELLVNKRWALGFHDRGHGHGDFGVVEQLPEGGQTDRADEELLRIVVPALIIPAIDRELAEHIIEVHNAHLERCHDIRGGLETG